MMFPAKNLQNNPNLRVGTSPRENPGSATDYSVGTIGGSKGDPMQFSGKFGKFFLFRPLEGWRPLLRGILDPPLRTTSQHDTSLPPATKLGQGYVFTRVCDSVHRGVSASVHAGIHLPGADFPPGADTTPGPDPLQIHLRAVADLAFLYLITNANFCLVICLFLLDGVLHVDYRRSTCGW